MTDPLGHTPPSATTRSATASLLDARGQTTSFVYDAANRRRRRSSPRPPRRPATFDAHRERELRRRARGRITRGARRGFGYDALARLVAVTDADDKTTSFAYDEVGNRISQTDPNGIPPGFEFDKIGRETRASSPGSAVHPGAVETKTYDDAGNLATRTDFMDRTTTYGYDPDNDRLTSRTYPDAAQNVSFTYTPTGRRKTAVDARGTTSYGYDQRDRLKSLTYPDGRDLGYDYDRQGNRTKLTATIAALSLVTSQTFDPLNRLATVTDPADRVSTYGYDENGNRESLVQPNGTETAYTYDALNRLTSLETTIPSLSRTIQSYAFTLGPAGNRTRIVEYAGLPQQRTLDYSYDALYRLTGERVTESLGLVYSKTFGYDPVGNRQTQTTTVGPAGSPGPNLQPGTIGYGYDERDRLLSEQLDANPATGYGWDTNGNLTTKDAEATYIWNHENRLIRVKKTDGTVVEYLYDVDGTRVRTSATPPGGSPTITDYLVDTSASLSHVVAEVDSSAATPTLRALYVRGDDLLAVMRPLVAAPASASDWQTRYYHADGIGSIRRLTDEGGNITDGYTYSAFGELLAHTGSDPQPYALTGEPLDPNSGWQYHRARWMDAGVGRFAGMDPFAGVQEEPATLHRYSYTSNDPVGKVDPTGRFESLAALSVGLSILNTLSGISLPSLQAVLGVVRPRGDYRMDFNGMYLRVLEKASGKVAVAYEALTGDPYFGWSESAAVGAHATGKYRVNKSDIQELNGSMGPDWGVGRVRFAEGRQRE